MPALAVDWTYIAQNFFSEIVLRGVWMTLQLSVTGMALGILLGTLFALARVSRQPVLRGASLGYIWFFRGTPCWYRSFSGISPCPRPGPRGPRGTASSPRSRPASSPSRSTKALT